MGPETARAVIRRNTSPTLGGITQVRRRQGCLFPAAHPGEHHPIGAEVEDAPGPDAVGGLGADDHGHVMCGAGQDLCQQAVLTSSPVLEVDKEPVEPGDGTGLGSQRGSHVQKRPDHRTT